MDERLNAYQTADTLGKTQLDLILKVYDGAIAALRAAASAYENNDNNQGYEQIVRSRRFVTHLYTTLNPEAGGEIAENLGKLYAFVLSQTHLAEATHDS
ncbi:MAG: flagellar protein FliS, partial [Candidatus Zixiibacteriota bacterium]